MKTKQLSLIVASIMATNSMAFALSSERSIETLKLSTSINADSLEKMLDSADKKSVQDLMMTYQEVQKLAASLRAIQNNNEQDPILNYANKVQVILVGASAIALNSHIKNAEKSRYTLQLAAATALLNSFIRHYSEIKNLKPSEVGVFLTHFANEMTTNKALSPEMIEMANSLNTISNQLIAQKSQIDTVISNLGGGSDIATGALVLLSLAHWVSPKLATEGDALLKTLSQKMAAGGATIAQNSKVIGATGATAGLPDLIGVTLGLDSTKSQEMIATTLNNLDIAARNLQAEINAAK